MHPVVSITDHTDFLDRLGPSLPTELGRFERADDGSGVAASSSVVLHFTYLDVPFSGRIERQGSETILRLTGAIGPLPFTAGALSGPSPRPAARRSIGASRRHRRSALPAPSRSPTR